MSKAAVSTTVTDLLGKGLLVETHTTPSGLGRRRIGLQVNQQAGLALGVEIAAQGCVLVLIDLGGQVVQCAVPSSNALAPSDAVREAAAAIKRMAPFDRPLVGIGVSVQGLVDAAGESAFLSAPEAWAGEAPLALLLREQLAWEKELPITLINAYHAGALAEHRCGAGQGVDDLIFISAGDRIGAGLVLGGELYPGASGSAGELGHVVVDPSGPRCTCGNLGCLEAFAGGAAVVALMRKALHEQAREAGGLALHDVVQAAVAGDLAALAAVRQAGEYLGLAVVSLVNALNPRRVVVGGQLAETGDTLMAPVRQAVSRRAAPGAYSTVDVVPASLGSQAAAIGAAAWAIDRYVLAYVS